MNAGNNPPRVPLADLAAQQIALGVELADVIVPGHGPVGGEAEVRDLQGYLRACVEARGDVSAIAAGPWDEWIDRERDAINVELTACLSGKITADQACDNMIAALATAKRA